MSCVNEVQLPLFYQTHSFSVNTQSKRKSLFLFFIAKLIVYELQFFLFFLQMTLTLQELPTIKCVHL